VGTLRIHSSAKDDFQRLYDSDPLAARAVATFFREANANPDLLDTFTIHNYGKNGVAEYDVSIWVTQQKKGRNLWRVDIYEVDRLTGEPYRFVYGFFPPSDHIILGIGKHDGKPTDFYDDEGHPFTSRVIKVYDSIR
jgi:hypothetical protein